MKTIVFLISIVVALALTGAVWAQQTDSAAADSAGLAAGVTQVPETPSEEAPADTIYPVTPERRALLNEYSNFRLGWSVFYEFINWILLLVVAFGGISAWYLNLAEKISSKKFVQFLVYLFFLLFSLALVTLPLDIYRDYFVEHKYGFSNQTFGQWFGEWLKAFPITYIVAAIALVFLYFLLRKYPRRWWLYFSIGAIPFVVRHDSHRAGAGRTPIQQIRTA